MTLQQALAALCACLALLAPTAKAAIIDFEDVVKLSCDASPIVTEGYTFSGAGSRCVFGPEDVGVPNANNGTHFMIEGGRLMILSNNLGRNFSLSRIDLGISFFNDMSPNFLTVTGFFAGGGSVSETLTLTNSFQTFVLSGFEDLAALSFNGLQIPATDGQIGYIAVDNLILTEEAPPNGEVPVPASVPLFALGMAVMAAVRRRQR